MFCDICSYFSKQPTARNYPHISLQCPVAKGNTLAKCERERGEERIRTAPAELKRLKRLFLGKRATKKLSDIPINSFADIAYRWFGKINKTLLTLPSIL